MLAALKSIQTAVDLIFGSIPRKANAKYLTVSILLNMGNQFFGDAIANHHQNQSIALQTGCEESGRFAEGAAVFWFDSAINDRFIGNLLSV